MLLVIALGYLAWLRDSGLVAIEKVQVVGIEGPEREAVTQELTRAASAMTTLNVDREALAKAVSGHPTVAGLDVDTHLPHGITVSVTERPPVLEVAAGKSSVLAAGDGTVLQGVDPAAAEVPSISVDALPAGGRLSGDALDMALVAGAAPKLLLPLIEGLNPGAEGIDIELRGDIPVIFGPADRAEEKWDAIAAILADPRVKELTALDVRVPERPSVGGAAVSLPPSTEVAPPAEEPAPVVP